MNPGGHGDDQFNKDLRQVGDAYRELQPDEPPALLDQAVLSRARRALESKSVRPWNFGWIHALTTAALVVLAVGIVVQMPGRQAGMETPPAKADLETGQGSYRARETIETPARPRPPESAVPAAVPEELLPEQEGRPESLAEPAGADITEDAPVAPDDARADAIHPAPAPDAAAAAGPARDPAAAEAPVLADEAARQKAARREAGVPAASAPAPSLAGSDAPEPAAAGAAERQPVGEMVVTGASLEEARAGVETERSSLDRAVEGDAGPGALRAANEQVREDPEAWLERIRALLAAGEREDFEAELEAFRAAWPDFELPPDLAAAGGGGD